MLPVLHNGSSLLPRTMPTNRLASLFDRFFNDDFFTPPTAPAWTALPLSMWDDEDAVYVEADAPGLKEGDIELSVHDGKLVIRGERKCERKENGFDARAYGRFEQYVTLPTGVAADQVEARLANGVLWVKLPKTAETKPRRIAIKAE